MKRTARLLLALSGHGYGHLAQSAPVVNALWAQLPSLQVTVCSSLPHEVIAKRLDQPFESRTADLDVVVPMRSAWEVDAPAAAQAWEDFHRELEAGLASDRELLGEIRPDLVLADIPYRILAAARLAGVPAVALCSLNWASIYEAYCSAGTDSEMIANQMWEAYRSADIFLAPEPAMEMPALANYQSIGAIARSGVRDRAALLDRLGLAENTRTVMVALGGIDSPLPLANWPCIEGVAWLFPNPAGSARHDLIDLDSTTMSFIDVLASVDAVITKPGYGTYAEAVCNGVPLLSLSRPDWPETVYLNAWARQHGRLQVISKQDFEDGLFATALQQLWQQPAPQDVPVASGIQQAAGILHAKLRADESV